MRKLIAIFCLVGLFVSHVGYYFAYLFKQYELKEAVKHQLLSQLPENSLEVFDLDINKYAIIWEEEGKEFYLHGELYDVARIKEVNGKKLLYCLNDKKEEELLKDLSELVKATHPNAPGKPTKHTIKFQLADLILFLETTVSNNGPGSLQYFYFNDTGEISCIKDVRSPPPKTRV